MDDIGYTFKLSLPIQAITHYVLGTYRSNFSAMSSLSDVVIVVSK